MSNSKNGLLNSGQEISLIVEELSLRKASKDFSYFLKNNVWTLDEHDKENPIKRFPYNKKYLQELSHHLVHERLLFIEKSRQMLVTWTCVAYCLWITMFNTGKRVFIQSKKEKDANEIINRAKFIYKRLPDLMKQKYKADEPMAYCTMRFGKQDSIIQGVPQGAEQLRQYTASVIFCVDPLTRILTSDLRWVLAGGIKKGDVLAGFDEESGMAGHTASGNGVARQWRKSVVKDICVLKQPCYSLYFSDGTTVISSAKHRWLRGYKQGWKWLSTERLRARGDSKHEGKGWAGSKVIKFIDVWDDENNYDYGYLAAAFDGDGCFRQKPFNNDRGIGSHVALLFSQNENEMLKEVKRLLKEMNFKHIKMYQKSKGYSSIHHTLSIGNRSEVMRFLGQIRPKRLLKKLDLDKWGTALAKNGVELLKKKYMGEREVVGITTSTSTFIAEGLASHNSDEMAFQEKNEEAFIAAKPTLTGGGQFIGVSSPNFKEFFYRCVSDKI